jgi:hypothetical protein
MKGSKLWKKSQRTPNIVSSAAVIWVHNLKGRRWTPKQGASAMFVITRWRWTHFTRHGSRANQELKDAKADYHAEWQKYKTDSEEQIKANEDRIDAFKAKMERADRKTKAKYNKAVAELKQKDRDLKRKFEEYKDEGESKWQEFKTNFSHDMDGVGNTM